MNEVKDIIVEWKKCAKDIEIKNNILKDYVMDLKTVCKTQRKIIISLCILNLLTILSLVKFSFLGVF